ncbi:enoyl-CoA hydratase/isomerase family protein [Ketobacter sp.]|nr:MAG: enoyl-CoA hydratase [Ketobacter sp.]|tara:strand:+ start:372 stop:1187 length:816 start_codon:yes stop_codon:yes gene_type:complete
MNIDKYRDQFPTLCFAEPQQGILELIFQTEAPLNTMNARMHNEVAYIWREIDHDSSVQVVLVRGAGKGFSAGGNFDLVSSMMNNDDTLLNVWKEGKDLVYNMINCSKPIISAIHGPAVGAGLAVALLADISIAAKNAKLIDSHTKLGVAAGDFAAILWPLLCGMAKAKYYLLTGKSITGEEAERIGMVSLCVEEAELYDTALDTAQTIIANSPSAVRWSKHSINGWLRMMGPNFDHSLALEMLGFKLPDIQEGLAAMQEKRPTNFNQNCPL